MAFTSFEFMLFFAIVFFVLWIIKWKYEKKSYYTIFYTAFLLAASYVFLILADWRFAVCVAVLTIVTYFTARKGKKWIVAGIILDIAQLAVFKYFNFFVGSFSEQFGYSYNAINIIVPLGVSFYTFSAVSYLIDVYREKYQAERNFAYLALFLSFFPKISSGPIVRADMFLSQLKRKPKVDVERLKFGIQIVVVGLFKKMVLADHLNVFVNDVFKAPEAFGSMTVLLATISYSLQIYFDFSGYSEIAIGLSKMMGFDFDKNFNLPYLSLTRRNFGNGGILVCQRGFRSIYTILSAEIEKAN